MQSFGFKSKLSLWSRLNGQRAVLGLAFLAFFARAIFCVWLFPNFFVKYATVGEQYFFDTYREVAAQMLAGNGYRATSQGAPILNRPPAYTIAVALTMPQHTRSALPLHILNSLLGALAVIGTYLLARSCRLETMPALFASAVVAVWPFLIWESKVSVPENLLVALFPFFFFALLNAIRKRSVSWTLAAAVIAAAVVLTHGLYQILVPLGTLALCVDRRRIRLAACYFCLSAALIAPWMIRNYRIAGYNIGVAAGFGYHYFKGLYTYERLCRGDYFRDFDREGDAFVRTVSASGIEDATRFRSDPGVNHSLDERAKSHIIQHPFSFMERGIIRLPLVWIQQQSKARSFLTAVLLLPLVLLSCLGFWSRGMSGDMWILPAILFALNFCVAAIFAEAFPMRYALPWMPLLAVLSARGIPAIRSPFV
jgi:hypothetical protein